MSHEPHDASTAVAEAEAEEPKVKAAAIDENPRRSRRSGGAAPKRRHYRVAASGQVVVEPGVLKESETVQEMARLAREIVEKTRRRQEAR